MAHIVLDARETNEKQESTLSSAASRQARHDLIVLHIPLVKKVASKIFFNLPRGDIDFDDLVNTGIIGLMKAAERYNEEKAKFSTYAYIKIRGEILDYLRTLDIVPRTMKEKIKKEAQENPEAKQLPLSNAAVMVSIEKALWEGEGSLRIIDTLVCEERSPEEEAIIGELKERLLEAMEELSPNERVVLQMLYFEESEPLEVANHLGISQSRVSQIKSQAIAKLKKIL